MLTRDQNEEFERNGFVRIPGAFSHAEAAEMEDGLWSALGRKYGVRRSDRATWKIPVSPGLQGFRTASVFDPIGGPATVAAIDDLVGEGRWEPPRHWGQFLVTFPRDDETWTVPTKVWHTDFPFYLPPDRVVGALFFSFLNQVPPGTGATLVVAGSHRVVRRFIAARPKLARAKMKVVRTALMASDPWLKALGSLREGEDRLTRFMETEHTIADIPVRVAELTGEPGDIIIGHPWLLHTGSPNCGDRPRFMRVQRIRPRVDTTGRE